MDNLIFTAIGLLPLVVVLIRFWPAIKVFVQKFKFVAKTFMEPDPVSQRMKEEEQAKKRKQDAEVAQEVEFTDVSEEK